MSLIISETFSKHDIGDNVIYVGDNQYGIITTGIGRVVQVLDENPPLETIYAVGYPDGNIWYFKGDELRSVYEVYGSDKDENCGDPIVEMNVRELRNRSLVGQKKYGVTLNDANQDIMTNLQHLLEEILDASNYIRKVMVELENKKPVG